MKRLLIATMIASTLLLGACATSTNVRPVYVEEWDRVQYGFIEDITFVQGQSGADGHQLRLSRGNTVAATAGVVGGALIDGDVEINQGAGDHIEVRVRLDDGTSITCARQTPRDFRNGDRVRIEGGRAFRG